MDTTAHNARGRRVRLFGGACVAVVLVGVLVAPVVLGRGSGVTHPCTQLLRYAGRVYARRPMPTPPLTQRLAIGVGTLVGCAAPTNVNVRSLAGIARKKEIAVEGDAGSVYVVRRS